MPRGLRLGCEKPVNEMSVFETLKNVGASRIDLSRGFRAPTARYLPSLALALRAGLRPFGAASAAPGAINLESPRSGTKNLIVGSPSAQLTK